MRSLIRPDWAHWRSDPATPDWTIGIEEEVMLLDPTTWSLAHVVDDVLPALSPELARSVAAETNAGCVELATGVHTDVSEAVEELFTLRARLRAELERFGLRAAAAGTHATSKWEDQRVSAGARYQLLQASLRDLTQREPTFALHVHIGVPDPACAVHVMNRMRVHLPLLLALSANSPLLRARDTGLASARTPLFQAFPRVGIPRRFESYDEWVYALEPIIASDAIPESTFLWWDVRLQPRLGTVEIRIMDAQTSVEDIGALVALIRALAMAEATDRVAPERWVQAPEVLDENRFLAARDGMDAEFIDPRTHSRVPARVLVEEMVDSTRLYASRLGCSEELDDVLRLAADPPADRQRAIAGTQGIDGTVAVLADTFCQPSTVAC